MDDADLRDRKRKRILPRSQPTVKPLTPPRPPHNDLHKQQNPMHIHKYPTVASELLQRRQAVDGPSTAAADVTVTVTEVISATVVEGSGIPTPFQTTVPQPPAILPTSQQQATSATEPSDTPTPLPASTPSEPPAASTPSETPVASTPTEPPAASAPPAPPPSSAPPPTPAAFSIPAASAGGSSDTPPASAMTTPNPTVNPGFIASVIVSIASKESSLITAYPTNGTAVHLSITAATVGNMGSALSNSTGAYTSLSTTLTTSTRGVGAGSSGSKSGSIMGISTASGSDSSDSLTFGATSDGSQSYFGSPTPQTAPPGASLGTATAPLSASTGTTDSGVGDSASPGELSPMGKSIVGGVVGGIAGVSVLLILAYVALRYYRRRRDESVGQSLSDGDNANPFEPAQDGGPSAAGPAFIPAAAMGMIKRLTRPHGPPPIETPPPPIGAGGFQRMGGRKLPSQFSPGMEGPGPGFSPSSSSNMTGPSPSYPSGSSHYPSGATYGSAALLEDPFADPVPTSPLYSSMPGSAAAIHRGVPANRQSPAQSPTAGRSAEMQMRSQNRPLLNVGRGTPSFGRGTPSPRGVSGSRFVEEDV